MKRTIYVVDADAQLLDLLSKGLGAAGYNVETFQDGNFILTKKSAIPALLILGKRLPGADGTALCSFLRAQPETQKLPVIMMSASPDAKVLAAEAGANDFIEKPFAMPQLLKKISQCMLQLVIPHLLPV